MNTIVHQIIEKIISGSNENLESLFKKDKDISTYILNNWEGIVNHYDADYIGCSAEGHISHLLSARLSSRPLGWSPVGANQMASLRVYQANKESN